MKVLLLNAVYGSGSTGVIVRDIQAECISNGIECICAYSSAKGEVEHGYHIGNRFTNKLHAILSRISGKQGYFSFCSTWKFLRFLDASKPDIVHLHNLHSNYINLNMLLKYLAKSDIRTIVTLHDCWFYTGGCTHYTAIGCDRWKSACGQCPKRYEEFPALLWDSSASQLADRAKLFGAIKNLTVVGVSKWITAEAKAGIFKNANCITIHNGINFDVFKPTPSDLRKQLKLEDKYIILGPASKWLQPINKLVLEYFCQNMQSDEVLLLFGVKDYSPLPRNVRLYGYTKDCEELAALYTCADVFVNPTREDALSLINIEAQACGTPVVTFDATGPKETVDGDVSVSIRVGDMVTLYCTVQMIRSRNTKSNIKYVCDRFDLIQNYRKYIKLYKSKPEFE